MMLPVGGASSADGALHASAGIPIAAAHAHASHGKYLLRPTARPPSLQETRLQAEPYSPSTRKSTTFASFNAKTCPDAGAVRQVRAVQRRMMTDRRANARRSPRPMGGKGSTMRRVLPPFPAAPP